MKYLILGGAGFLGNNLIRFLLNKKSSKITVVDSMDKRLKSNIDNLKPLLSKIDFIKGDIRSRRLMAKVVKNQNVIINCATQTSHSLSFKNPYFDVDVACLGNITVLEAIKNNNPGAKIIFVSSSTVIGKAIEETVDEKHGEKPIDLYSANKGIVEKYHYIYNKVYNLQTVSLRFANLYGPYGKPYQEFGFINYFIGLANLNREIPVYGSGRQIRNVMYVEDACDLLYRCALSNTIYGDVYFAVHREHYPVIDIARMIIKVFEQGNIKKIRWPDIRKKIEIENVYITGAKLFYKIKWEPKYDLEKGLIKTKEIISKNSNFQKTRYKQY